MLDTVVLVVDDVEGRVVRHKPVDWVVGEPQPAVIVQSLDAEKGEEDGGCRWRHAGEEGSHEAA